jgi:hypothetical protein
MARVPLVFSQGHHPHPKLAFGPPLPVGIHGPRELIDAELLEPWSPGLAERLNTVLPEGLRILSGEALPAIPNLRRPSLAQLARRARYRLDIADLPETRRTHFAATARAFAAVESCVVDRTYWTPESSREALDWEAPMDTVVGGTGAMPARDRRPPGKVKETRRVDLKQALLRLEPAGTAAIRDANRDGTPASSAPGPVPGCSWIMEAWLDHPRGHVANPRVVLEQLFHFSPEEQARVQVTREAILREDSTPLAG